MSKIPHFEIKNNFQKDTRGYFYKDIITSEVLIDISEKISGQKKYTFNFDNEGYNKGRLAIVDYNNTKIYISFSEIENGGRNSSFQSLSTALIKFYQEKKDSKEIYFYFLPQITGSFETKYFIFMYRLMKTARIKFLNEEKFLSKRIESFSSVEDIMVHKNLIRDKNKSNNSTYLTRSTDNILQIYGKTYGASKYETSLLCIAISEITIEKIELYQISEQNLSILPAPALEVINKLGKIYIITNDLTMEKNEYNNNNSLRSPRYIYNLLSKLGDKKCTLCDCEIPQLIQGAHIWPVADIKKAKNLTFEQKLSNSIDENNGIWLCQNHHKLFDTNILIIDKIGKLKYDSYANASSKKFIKDITLNDKIADEIMTTQFLGYLNKRNNLFNESFYTNIYP